MVKRLKQEFISSLTIMGMRGAMLAAKFLLALFIARFMGLEELGLYGLIAGLAAVGPVVMRFGIFSVMSREAVSQTVEELTHNLRHYITGCIVAYLCLMPLFLGIGWYFDVIAISMLTFFVVIFEQASYDIFVITNNLHKPKLANAIYTLQSAAWIYLFVILAFFFPGFRSLQTVLEFWIIGGIIAVAITIAITRHWPWKAAFSSPLSREWYRPYWQKSWQLYIAEIIGVINLYADRYLITLFFSLELVGIYVLFWQVSNAICALIGAGVLQIYRPRLIAAYKSGDTAKFKLLFRENMIRGLSGLTFLSVVCAIIVPFLIRFTNKGLAIEYLPLFWGMIAVLGLRIAADVGISGLYAQHKDRANLRINFIRLFASLVISLLCFWIMGIYGVVVSFVLTYLVTLFYIRREWVK